MTRTEQVLAAMREGHDTAPKIALTIGVSRDLVAAKLQKMREKGLVDRAGTVTAAFARPATVWRICDVVVPRKPKPRFVTAKPKPQRVTPPAQVTASTRRATDAKPPKAGNAPLFPPAHKDTRNEITDTRRPQNELQDRLLNESLRGVTSFRPDPPAEKRGAVNVTAGLMGDPSPGRREELERRRTLESNPRTASRDWA